MPRRPKDKDGQAGLQASRSTTSSLKKKKKKNRPLAAPGAWQPHPGSNVRLDRGGMPQATVFLLPGRPPRLRSPNGLESPPTSPAMPKSKSLVPPFPARMKTFARAGPRHRKLQAERIPRVHPPARCPTSACTAHQGTFYPRGEIIRPHATISLSGAGRGAGHRKTGKSNIHIN